MYSVTSRLLEKGGETKVSDSSNDKDYLDKVDPERRDFVRKMTKAAFIVPAVVSVAMLDQKLNVSTAMAVTGNIALP
jgi:hypothetical protein